MNTSLPDNPLSSSGIKERSRIMTDGQPLKERREAEKAELFQKGRVRARVTHRKRKDMLTKEGRTGFILMQRLYYLYYDCLKLLKMLSDCSVEPI